jgi:hypothetical protein
MDFPNSRRNKALHFRLNFQLQVNLAQYEGRQSVRL